MLRPIRLGGHPLHPAQDTALWHVLSMGAAWCVFVTCWLARGNPESGPPLRWTILVELVGVAAMTLGGWMGGQLVYRYGVGPFATQRGAGEPRDAATRNSDDRDSATGSEEVRSGRH